MFNELPQIIFDGDSISAGAGASPGMGLDAQVVKGLSFDTRSHNIAVGGKPVYECLEKFDALVAPLRNYNAPVSIIAFHAGDNDLVHGKNAKETYKAFSQYVQRAKAQGWKVVVTTELQIYRFTEEMQRELRHYNQLLLQNKADADIVIDLDREPGLVDPAARRDPVLFTADGIHPADAGYALIARALCEEIESLWKNKRAREKVVLLGEVQMLAIHWHLLEIMQQCQSERHEFNFVDSNDLRATEMASASLKTAVKLILQINPERPQLYEGAARLLAEMRGKEVCLVPMVLCKSLWPYDFPEQHNDASPESVSAATRGDTTLRELAKTSLEPSQAALNYLAANLHERIDLNEVYATDIARWKLLDAFCDVQLADFLQSEFRRHKLFHSYKLPSNLVIAKIMRHIGMFLGLSENEMKYSAAKLSGLELLQPDTPIHPSVIKHFGLGWVIPDGQFDIFGAKVDYVTWANDYVMRMSSQGQQNNDTDDNSVPPILFKSLLEARWERDRFEDRLSDAFLADCLQHFDDSRAQLFQDIFVLSKLNFKRNGFFVEFGATDGKTISNTYLLEKEFGWKGIVAEPLPFWHDKLAANRSCLIDHRCVWSNSGETVEFWVDHNHPDLATIEQFKMNDSLSNVRAASKRTIQVKTVSLNQLLEENNAPTDFDYLSIDTEGSELNILSSFDFSKYAPKIITVEHNYNDEQRRQIFNLLTQQGYQRVYEELSRWDDWYIR